MALTTTWKHLEAPSNDDLPAICFAFPRQRMYPLTDADCVRRALVDFPSVPEASDRERQAAFQNIIHAAEHFHLEIYGASYEDMCLRPQVEVVPMD